jgi:formate dehydrogenase iron-sulfur subunit
MCIDWLRQDRPPACVEACPQQVLEFGSRRDLLAEAHHRIRNHPDIYRPRVWGEDEFGGTSVLYISDVDLAALGWPEEAPVSIPSITEPLIHKTPLLGLSVACGLIGLNWIVKRRNKLAAERSSGTGNGSDTQKDATHD